MLFPKALACLRKSQQGGIQEGWWRIQESKVVVFNNDSSGGNWGDREVCLQPGERPCEPENEVKDSKIGHRAPPLAILSV